MNRSNLPMKHTSLTTLLIAALLSSCGQNVNSKEQNDSTAVSFETVVANETGKPDDMIIPSGTTLSTRFLPPKKFERIEVSSTSFSNYLRNLPLKPHGSEVMKYDGNIKANRNIYDAVVDMEIGNKNLHQCADAVMRFRAEYLWEQQRYDDIHFNLTNGFRVDYSEWMKGKRIAVEGNKTYWVNRTSASNNYVDFWSYMELIFNYAGTLSLSKELIAVNISDINIGDVFIKGGSPGHAVLVVDMAVESGTGEKIFLLAQSYMPAQETQILKNPNNSELSPWYAVEEIDDRLETPEWTFSSNQLKRFKD